MILTGLETLLIDHYYKYLIPELSSVSIFVKTVDFTRMRAPAYSTTTFILLYTPLCAKSLTVIPLPDQNPNLILFTFSKQIFQHLIRSHFPVPFRI